MSPVLFLFATELAFLSAEIAVFTTKILAVLREDVVACGYDDAVYVDTRGDDMAGGV